MADFVLLSYGSLAIAHAFLRDCRDEAPTHRRTEGVPPFATPHDGVFRMDMPAEELEDALLCIDPESELLQREEEDAEFEPDEPEEEAEEDEDDGYHPLGWFAPVQRCPEEQDAPASRGLRPLPSTLGMGRGQARLHRRGATAPQQLYFSGLR